MVAPGGTIAEEREGSRLPMLLLKVFAIGGVLLVAVVGVLGYTGWLELERQTRAALEGNPVIAEHIGAIEELRYDFGGSAAEEGPDTFVLRLRGDRGTGEVTATIVTVDDETEELVAGELRLADGRVLPLFPEDVPTED